MPDPLTEDEIENLKQKVLAIPDLSEGEQNFTEEVFLAATIRVKEGKALVESESILIRLRNQFTNAFFPGDTAGVILAAIKIKPSPPKK
jgi:hypothetical protein